MKGPSLTDLERRIAKRLICDGERNQDVHVLINIGRSPTVNFGRFSKAKEWPDEPATDEEVARFRYEKSLVDLRTGLSPLENERLFKAREAMLLAVQAFNSPLLLFKVEVFSVLSNIAWTYLIHEFYERKGVEIVQPDGHTLALSTLMAREDFPLKGDPKKNLIAMKAIRDDVEHRTLEAFGTHFYSLFQANCLNFEETIRVLFGDKLSLGDSLSLALQFSKLSLDQLSQLQKFDVSPAIEAIEQKVVQVAEETGKEGVNYKFKVNFSMEASSKGNANIQFINDNTKGLFSVLAQKVSSDELWPYKPMAVVAEVKTVEPEFSSHLHMLAWKKMAVRPNSKSAKPENCDKKYCTFNKAHKDYTYSQAWVDLLKSIVADEGEFAELAAYKP